MSWNFTEPGWRIEKDTNGRCRALVPAHLQALADFLEPDLQTPAGCDEVLRHLEAVASKTRERWEQSGNLCTLTLTPEQAHIGHAYLPGSCILPLPKLKAAVRLWQKHIAGKPPET
jgi:hypothetical protein